ncbi:MAG: M4 family metallopeptidase [Lewinellaceae bacterium]|nr:M4 family metallopeptidase [Lewinellaceae bacterium]
MKFLPIFFFWALLFCFPLQIFGQKSTLSKAHFVKTYTFYKNTDPSLNHLNYFDAMAGNMRLSPQSKMVLTEESADKYGYKHYKFQQFHEGLPIFGCRYILHEKEDKVVTANGHYSPQAIASSKPGINAATAVAFAKQAMKAREYATRAVEPILCFVDPAFPQVSEILRLAYMVDLHSTEPFGKHRYFVDAASGKIVNQFPLVLQEGVPSTGKTRYYGVQNIITDSIAPQQFVLRDPTRGDGIFIYNSDGSNFTNTSSTWDLTNDNQDEVALDAHFCTQEYYDMMLSDYNWQGLDGNGRALKVNVHGGAYANAFWDGESSTYGDGDCNYGPLTTLEVVGHEFTHGMIDYTSRLVYSSESGAINESLADMFGKLLERKTDPANFSWDLGHSFLLSPDISPFRVMDDPNSLEMPAFYKGQFWVDGGGVHTNSSIGNLWFSMLVDGKQGVNEMGASFNVPALGPDKVGQIVFEVNKNYLTEGSDYNQFYQASITVAESLYGAGSTEALAVEEAWNAVGLPGTPTAVLDLSISGSGFNDNNFCGLGQFIPVNFKVINSSGVAYNPSMMATVTLTNFSLPDYIVDLTSPIGPGEVFDIQVDNWLLATSLGFNFVSATLNLIDENQDNNFNNNYYNVTEFASDDLSLYANISVPSCFATEQNISFYVENSSCETLPAGTQWNFTATDDNANLVWTSPPYILAEDLISGGTVFINYEVPAINSGLNFALVYPNDPEPFNNEYYAGSGQTLLPITGNYLNNFETNDGEDGYLALEGAVDPTIFYQNSQFFASTGYAQNPEEFQHCSDILKVFNAEYADGINATINACVDFSFSPAPVLEFDLAQFRNAFAVISNYDYSSMIQAKWKGTETGNQIIFGQPEGQVIHHNIALPPFFKGELGFKLYTELGLWGVDPMVLDENDFVLLDNLKLSAPLTATDDLETDATILVSPNPARETATIQAAEGIKTILLQNLNGQTLQSLHLNTTSYEIDLKGLKNGFYLLNIQLENGAWGVKKLVKMD